MSTSWDATATTAAFVRSYLGAGRTATSEFQRWCAKKRRNDEAPLIDLALNHITRVPYILAPDDIHAIARATRHALGPARVNATSVKPVTDVSDWESPIAFTYAFHHVLEQRQGLYTWDEFLDAASTIPVLRRYLHEPAQEAVAVAAEQHGRQLAADAMGWRLGNAYYSFLRELHVIAVGRSSGLRIQCHPLADALYRTDAWAGTDVLSIYVENERYLSKVSGRKHRAYNYLRDCPTPLTFRNILLVKKAKFGQLMVADQQQIVGALLNLPDAA